MRLERRLRQVLGKGNSELLEDTISDNPGGLAAITFNLKGVCCVSKAFEELMDIPSSQLHGTEFVKVPCYSHRPEQQRVLNGKAWRAILSLHAATLLQQLPGMHSVEKESELCMLKTNSAKPGPSRNRCSTTQNVRKQTRKSVLGQVARTARPRPLMELLVGRDRKGALIWLFVVCIPTVGNENLVTHVLFPLRAKVPELVLQRAELAQQEAPLSPTTPKRKSGPISYLVEDLLADLQHRVPPWRDTLDVPNALEAAEAACQSVWNALLAQNAYCGAEYVPQLGVAANLEQKRRAKWDSCFSQALKESAAAGWCEGADKPIGNQRGPAFVVSDPNRADCPLVYISPGFEDLTGYFRSFALGRNCRFVMQLDSRRNKAYNGPELEPLEHFCAEQDEGRYLTVLYNQRGNSAHTNYWCLLYLEHIVLEDPDADRDSVYDCVMKDYVFGLLVPLELQKAALDDMFQWERIEQSSAALTMLRESLADAFKNPILPNRSLLSMVDAVLPRWMLDCGKEMPTNWVGCNYVPRLGLAPAHGAEGCWSQLIGRASQRLEQLLGASKEVIDATTSDSEEGLAAVVLDLTAVDSPVVFMSRAFQKQTGYTAAFGIARNLRFIQPGLAEIKQAINEDELEHMSELDSADATKVALLLCERANGACFWGLLLLMRVNLRRPYVLATLIEFGPPLPTVLYSQQVSTLQIGEMGPEVDEWGLEVQRLRAELSKMDQSSPGILNKVSGMLSERLLTFLKGREDYCGDLFVPRIGLPQSRKFQEQGVLPKLLEAVFGTSTPQQHSTWTTATVVADPEGEDNPLVYVSPEFEALTGYKSDWALGRNVRFLLPRSEERNRNLNLKEIVQLRAWYKDTRMRINLLMLCETRDNYPMWILGISQKVHVGGKMYFVSQFVPLDKEAPVLVELCGFDQEALTHIERLREMLGRQDAGLGGLDSFQVVRHILQDWMEDLPSSFCPPQVTCSKLKRPLPLIGLEITESTARVEILADALRNGVRHFHVVFRGSAGAKDPVRNENQGRLLALRLAECLGALRHLHLHGLRAAVVVTLRTQAHMLSAFPEVVKALTANGYSLSAWLLDVRGLELPELSTCWKVMSMAQKAGEVEALGIFGGGRRTVAGLQGMGLAPVALFATDPGQRTEENDPRLLSELRRAGTGIISCGGGQKSNIEGAVSEAASNRKSLAIPEAAASRKSNFSMEAAVSRKSYLNPEAPAGFPTSSSAVTAVKWAEHIGAAAVLFSLGVMDVPPSHEDSWRPDLHRTFTNIVVEADMPWLTSSRASRARPSCSANVSRASSATSASVMIGYTGRRRSSWPNDDVANMMTGVFGAKAGSSRRPSAVSVESDCGAVLEEFHPGDAFGKLLTPPPGYLGKVRARRPSCASTASGVSSATASPSIDEELQPRGRTHDPETELDQWTSLLKMQAGASPSPSPRVSGTGHWTTFGPLGPVHRSLALANPETALAESGPATQRLPLVDSAEPQDGQQWRSSHYAGAVALAEALQAARAPKRQWKSNWQTAAAPESSPLATEVPALPKKAGKLRPTEPHNRHHSQPPAWIPIAPDTSWIRKGRYAAPLTMELRVKSIFVSGPCGLMEKIRAKGCSSSQEAGKRSSSAV